MKAVVFWFVILNINSALGQKSRTWDEMEQRSKDRQAETQRIMDDSSRRQEQDKINRRLDELEKDRDLSPMPTILYVPIPVAKDEPVPEIEVQAVTSYGTILGLDASTGKTFEPTDANILSVSKNEATLSESDFNVATERSRKKIAKMIPEFNIEGHPIHKRAEEMWLEAKKNEGPIIFVTDAPWIVYAYAARSLNLIIRPQ